MKNGNTKRTVITGIDYLVTVDTDRRVLRDATVVIEDGKFAWVGTSSEAPAFETADHIDARGRVGIPGLIDCHLHSSFQLSRGLADEANAREFLIERMYPYEASLSEADVRVSALLASRESLLNGTTCFVDPGNQFPESTVTAVSETGQRAVIARSAFDLKGSDFGSVPDSLVSSPEQAQEEAEQLIRQFEGAADGRVSASVSFRGLNNSSDELIRGLAAVSAQYDKVLQTHACFSYSTHDASVAKHGKPEVQRLADLGVLNERSMLVHSGWLEPEELVLIRDSGAGVVIAPTSSMHNGYGNITMGHAPEFAAMGVPVGLGTDHACSGSNDIVREMFLVACGYKEVRINPRVMPPETALEMATIRGAEVLGMSDRVGSVEVGKEADLVLFDTDHPSWQPLYNPVSNLVYSATGNTADTVLVGGEPVVRGGKLVQISDDEILEQGRATANDLFQRLDGSTLVRALW